MLSSALPRLPFIEKLDVLASRGNLCVATFGVLAFTLCAVRALIWGTPAPSYLDEFSYLLAADTFASGRMANPTHPMWVHFESIHINQQPTYASKYPPGQGLVLAAGQALFGHPIIAVWLSTACACAAVCWMLLAWAPGAWALAGAFIAMVRLVAQYWGHSFWGGSLAALGGALLFHGIPRIPDRFRFADGLRMGFGLAILANTRPYEGCLVTACAVIMLLVCLRKDSLPSRRLFFCDMVLPVFLVLVPTFAVMAVYNQRVTGNPLRMPYQVNAERYFPVPFSLLGHPGPKPIFNNKEIEGEYENLYREYADQLSLRGFARAAARKFWENWTFYAGLCLTIPLIALPSLLRDQWSRFAIFTCGATAAGLLFSTAVLPHYVAPLTALIYVLIAQSMKRFSQWRWRNIHAGGLIILGILTLHVFLLFAPARSWGGQLAVVWRQPWATERADLLERLNNHPNRHLVLVRYSPGHDVIHEWVYNRADIDRAKVVWARDLGPAHNDQLLRYFQDRRVWLLEPDLSSPRLSQLR